MCDFRVVGPVTNSPSVGKYVWVSTELVSVAGDDDEESRDLRWRNIGMGGGCTSDIHCQNRIQLRQNT